MTSHGINERAIDGFVDKDSFDAETDLTGVEKCESCDLQLSAMSTIKEQ
tara:strand:- start:1498 stop:1644 length:147 start_codon:yes stop_codon:yes gene_type:complete